MSHHTEENIACPNCGHQTTLNYCAQCGQETYLHKETFWGLVMHFIGHYLHYDSKFWQTLKTLITQPGKLTSAYWNGQRMRYIAPISLYIFISFVGLFAYSKGNAFRSKQYNQEKTARIRNLDFTKGTDGELHDDSFSQYLQQKLDKIKTTHHDVGTYLAEWMGHNFPKVFFFMIPMMSMLLFLFFARRKSLFFVNHAVFSLHYHCFWFICLFASALNPFASISRRVQVVLLFLVPAIYLCIAIKNAYAVKPVKAIIYGISISLIYTLFLGISAVATFMLAIALS